MNKTGIDYVSYTWNPSKGCDAVSTGCEHCWAKGMSKRLAGMGQGGYDPADPFKVVTFPDRLNEPLKMKKPQRIAVSFMGDLFHDDVPDQFIKQVFDAMRAADWHEYVLLTKRPERAARLLYDKIIMPADGEIRWIGWEQIRIGVSIENMDVAHERMKWLGHIPLKYKWISIEPMVGAVYLKILQNMHQIGQITLGGESGPGARPMYPEWAEKVRDDCADLKIPFWFKQWGGGRSDHLLDGVKHQEWFNG